MSGASGKMNSPITSYGNGILDDLLAVEIDHADGTERHPIRAASRISESRTGDRRPGRLIWSSADERDGVHGAVACGVDRHDQVANGNGRARASSVSSWAASPSVTCGASPVTFERQPAKYTQRRRRT